MNHMRIVVAISAMALVVGACTTAGATPDGGVATLSEENSPNPDTTTQDALSNEEAIEAYNECVTNEGVPDLAISENSDTGGAVNVDPSSPDESSDQADVDFDAFEKAMAKCGKYLESAFAEFDMSPEQEAAIRDAELAFNKCMKEQGFDLPEFDDASGDLLDSDAGDGSLRGSVLDIAEEDFEKFSAASEECASVTEAINEQSSSQEAGG